jgi:adenine deaminase
MASSNKSDPRSIHRRAQAALGQIECDTILKNVNYLDVFSCDWRQGDIAIIDGTIVGIEPGLKGSREFDCKDRFIVPGFVDAHVHIESSLVLPFHFQSLVLPHGTTTAICDPHEIANVKGVTGIQYFLGNAAQMDMNLWVMLSSCVPTSHLETNGGGEIDSTLLTSLIQHPNALGLAEILNIPGFLNGDREILKKISDFSQERIDGHCLGLRGQTLSAFATAGISSCHESSEVDEAREKLSKGMAVWIREGSVAKNVHDLGPLLELANSTSIGFCTDDRGLLDIMSEGHIDYLVRETINMGAASPEVVYRSASWTAARHYGLDMGHHRIGAIAPGYQADFVFLGDYNTVAIDKVMKAGRFIDEIEKKNPVAYKENTIRTIIPEAKDLEGPNGLVHVIEIEEKKIITGRSIKAHDTKGVAHLSVLERYGKKSKPANAYVSGFGENFRGAMASSVSHDSHNLIVVGDRTEDMRIALSAITETGGGFCVVQNGKVLARLPLPFGGLMSNENPEIVRLALIDLAKASQAVGCALSEPFLQLGLLSQPLVPALKLTDKGLVDVAQFKIINVRAS